MKNKFYYKIALLCFLVIFPFALLILPANFFDKGRSICLSQLLANKECIGCGMTRGIMHLIHLEMEEAFAYNMLSFIVLPLLIVIWVKWILKEWYLCKLIIQQKNHNTSNNN